MVKLLTANDILEIWASNQDGRVMAMHHELLALDGRAKLLVNFVQQAMHTIPIADAMVESHGQPPGQREDIRTIVMRCAEMVDAIYDEARHRGWAMEIPTFSELTK